MSGPLVTPSTAMLTLEQALARIHGHDDVEGVVLLGSTATGAFTAASDFDVLIVTSSIPADFHVEVTQVDGRLTDVLVVGVERLREAAAGSDEDDRRICQWLSTGRAVFDRHGILAEILAIISTAGPPPPGPDPAVADRERSQVSYDVLVSENHARSNDHVYVLALRLRELHAFSRLLLAYFRVRGLTWRGEKWAVHHLETHDRDFLALVREWLDAEDPPHQVALHRRAAEAALKPVGGLWPEGRFPIADGVWERLTR
jgi:predicted nucleotidyltransferase